MSKHPLSVPSLSATASPFERFADSALAWGLGILCLLVSVSFYTGTYDTAFVKITLLQMGGTALSALWIALLAAQKRWPVTRQNLVWLLPFLVYFGWNLLGYIFAPYKLDGAEECLRYVLYFLLSLMVLDRFNKQSVHILTKCITLAAWISCGYGLLQVLDRWLPGVDMMPWRGFFGTRIFSTHANPNFFADFVVFSSFIVFAEYLRTRQKRLLVLLGIALVDLFFSESKGAWLGFAASAAFFAALYTNFAAAVKKHLRKINIAAAVLLLGAVLLVGIYAGKRFQSVSFRAYTWAASFAMVQDSPVMGTGVGSFKTIYPAYRKPQIFYIENMHNNETQHAENEYLEQWATAGTIGLAVFLWLLLFVLYCAAGTLRAQAAQRKEGETLSAQSWWALGYSAAFFGIVVHNFFDISIRFVSTGLFFAVFAALLVRLAMPLEQQEKAETESQNSRFPLLLWLARAVLAAGVCCAAGALFWQFRQTAGNVGANGLGGLLLKVTAWGVFVSAVLGMGWVYLRAAFLSRLARVPAVLALSLLPIYGFWGLFLADHYYGIAAEFSRRQLWDGALDYYQKAIDKNPLTVSLLQYRSYILRQTADLQRSHSPSKGDRPTDAPLNDYERVVRDLTFVSKHSPNNALFHQSYGEFYYTYAVRYTQLSLAEPLAYRRAEYEAKAVENMELAKKSFQHSLLVDPVNESTYVFLASIALMERNPVQAQAWIDAYRRGPQDVTEPEFLARHKQSERLDGLERRLRQPPFNYFPDVSSDSDGK